MIDLEKILEEGENSSAEYKSVATREIVKEVAAFASSRGGVIVVGISDSNRDIIGLDEPFDSARQKVQSWIHEFVSPAPTYSIGRMEYDRRELLVVIVEPGPEAAYAFKDKFYYRNNEQSQPIPASEVTRRFSDVRMRHDLMQLAQRVERSRPEDNTAAAILGQGELATLNYHDLLERLIRDLHPHFLTR